MPQMFPHGTWTGLLLSTLPKIYLNTLKQQSYYIINFYILLIALKALYSLTSDYSALLNY